MFGQITDAWALPVDEYLERLDATIQIECIRRGDVKMLEFYRDLNASMKYSR